MSLFDIVFNISVLIPAIVISVSMTLYPKWWQKLNTSQAKAKAKSVKNIPVLGFLNNLDLRLYQNDKYTLLVRISGLIALLVIIVFLYLT